VYLRTIRKREGTAVTTKTDKIKDGIKKSNYNWKYKLLTLWRRALLENLIVAQLIKKNSILHGTRGVHCVHNSLPLDSILSQLNTIHTFALSFLEKH
jgi:hypothetical protein